MTYAPPKGPWYHLPWMLGLNLGGNKTLDHGHSLLSRTFHYFFVYGYGNLASRRIFIIMVYFLTSFALL